MSEIKAEIRRYWEQIKQWPLYILLGITSLWLILPFSFWLLRGEAVKNLDQLITELQQKQEDIKQSKQALEQFKQDQKIELTTVQKDSLKRLARHDENTLLQLVLFFLREFPLYLFFFFLGILLENRYHFSTRFKSSPLPKNTSSKIKIYSPASPSSPSQPNKNTSSSVPEGEELGVEEETSFEDSSEPKN